MKLNELFETGTKHVTFCFGRMNPPTIGHAEVFKTMASVGGDFKIFVSQTQDKKSNPLDYQTKIKFIKLIHPQFANNVVDDSTLNTVVKVASYLYDMGYKDATFVAGSDRLDQFKSLLTQYNGVEGKSHGFYKFEVLDFKSSGDREDGAEGVTGVSASNARAAAASGDFDAFKEATGAGQFSEELYNAVRKGLGVNEEVEEGWSDKYVAQRTGRPRTPYSVYIKGKKWKDFANDDHAQNVMYKLQAKFKADGRDPSVITIAPTDYDKDFK